MEKTDDDSRPRHRHYWRRFSLELAGYLMRGRDSKIVNSTWLVPRLIANSVLGREFYGPLRAQYLVQLERAGETQK